MQTIIAEDWGLTEYGNAWERQEALLADALEAKTSFREAACRGEISTKAAIANRLIFCEHPPVYTLGKSGHSGHLLLNDGQLKSLNAAFYKTNRGGDITYHGPGQIVGYPIFDLENFRTDLGWYMRSLEEVIIRTVAYYGLEGSRLPGATGVWIDAADPAKARKICAMGVRCSRWVTMHGFALNVNTDLSYFGHIIPCGIADKGVTSIAAECGRAVAEQEVKETILNSFSKVFEAEILHPEEALTSI